MLHGKTKNWKRIEFQTDLYSRESSCKDALCSDDLCFLCCQTSNACSCIFGKDTRPTLTRTALMFLVVLFWCVYEKNVLHPSPVCSSFLPLFLPSIINFSPSFGTSFFTRHRLSMLLSLPLPSGLSKSFPLDNSLFDSWLAQSVQITADDMLSQWTLGAQHRDKSGSLLSDQVGQQEFSKLMPWLFLN